MRQFIEVVALFLGFGGWVLVYFSLENHYWKESTQDGSVILTSDIYENLWMSCASDSTGVYDCRDFPSLFALSVNSRKAGKKKEDKMNPTVEAFACFLGFLGWIMVGVALPHRYWKESAVDGNVITTSTIYENLWLSCATDSTGVHNCHEFPSLLTLNGYIQASRALMIASIVFGTFGLVATLVGMQCTKVCGENYLLKGRITAIGGVFFLLQGLCTMIAVSWYAANITQDFFDPFYPGIKYEIGQGLYIGWSSAVLALCGGSCLLCACKLNSSEEKTPYLYQPASRGHVLSTVAVSQSEASNYGRNAYV